MCLNRKNHKTMRIFLFNFLFIGFLVSVNTLSAQNSRSNETNAYAQNTEKIDLFGSQKARKTPKIKKSDLPKIRYAKDRNPFLEQRIEEKRSNAKDMKKPQYTKKMYFGHKNPPKKRPIGKRKHCRECGLTH